MSGDEKSFNLKVEIRFAMGRRFVIPCEVTKKTLKEAQEDAVLAIQQSIELGYVLFGYWGMIATTPFSFSDVDKNQSAVVVSAYETISCMDPAPFDIEQPAEVNLTDDSNAPPHPNPEAIPQAQDEEV